MKRLLTHLCLRTIVLFLTLLCSMEIQATDRLVYDTGNNAHYIEYGDKVTFAEWNGSSKVALTGNNSGKIVMYGWFKKENGTILTTLDGGAYYWNGPTGVYSFQNNGHNFIAVKPMKASVDNKYNNNPEDYYGGDNQFKTNDGEYFLFYNLNNGGGAIWASGDKNFGFPCVSPANDWTPNGWAVNAKLTPYGDNTVSLFKENDKNVYSIVIETGQQMTRSNVFSFKLYHSPLFEVYENNEWERYYEFRHKEWERNSSVTETTIELRNKIDYMYVKEGNGKDGNNNENHSYNEGNITALIAGFDSELPTMPDGYIFTFKVDLTTVSLAGKDYKGESLSYTHVPLDVDFKQNDKITNYYSSDTKTEGTYIVHLNNSNNLSGTKRIWLRDALRFDCNVPYAKSYVEDNAENYTEKLAEVRTFDKLIITGELNQTDIQYLSWLACHDKIVELDLTQAKLPSNQIPKDFANGYPTYNEKLTTVKLPAALERIGVSAFQGCTGLISVTSAGNPQNSIIIDAHAFDGCTSLKSDEINKLIKWTINTIQESTYANCTNGGFNTVTIPSTIATIEQFAFAHDVNLTEVNVPNHIDATAISSGTLDNPAPDADKVGSSHSINGQTNVVPTHGFNLPAGNFNEEKGKGYGYDGNARGFTEETKRADTRKSDADCGIAILDDNYSEIHYMRGDYWFNYTFECTEAGLYTVTCQMKAWDSDKSMKVSFSDDGEHWYSEQQVTATQLGGNINQLLLPNKIPLTKGYHVMKIQMQGGTGTQDMNILNFKLDIEKDNTAPIGLPGNVGYPYGTNGNYQVPSIGDGGKIEAEDFNCGEGVGYLHQSRDNGNYRTNSYRKDDAKDKVGLSNRTVASNNYSVDFIENGDFYNYTFNTESNNAGIYTISIKTGTVNSGRTMDVYLDGRLIGNSLPVYNNGSWDSYTNENQDVKLENIGLTTGYHVLKIGTNGGANLDVIQFKRTNSSISISKSIPDCLNANSFEGINANHCEVKFTGSDNNAATDYNQYTQYRAVDASNNYIQKGWMYLLTKKIYEDDSSDPKKPYDVCHQAHADVRMYRNFGNVIWDSMVLPFDVNAGDANDNNAYTTSVRTKEAKIDYAAILISASENNLQLLNVGTHNDKAGEASVGQANYQLKAGTPFVIHLNNNAISNDDGYQYVTFIDVETKASDNVEPGYVEKSPWTFYGTFNAITQGNVPPSGVFALSNSKIVQATKTAKFKGYRGWFQKTEEDKFPVASAAKATAFSLTFSTDDTAVPTDINRLVEDGRLEIVDAIYTLDGRKVPVTRWSNLPKGLYIVNGKKKVVK